MKHPIDIISRRYPQLTMPIGQGVHLTEEYRNICLRGAAPVRAPDFIRNENDTLETVHTPAGDVEVLTLCERQDFEHAYRALAHKCEPAEIPLSTGAVTLIGLTNWDKIRALTLPLSQAPKSACKDYFILLSAGPYSHVSGGTFGIDDAEWLSASVTIRKYHELTHFVSRNLYPENKEAIRDEIMADMIGLLFAFGKYYTDMARTFLGLEGENYRQGGRLQNYVPDSSSLEEVIQRARTLIALFSKSLPANAARDPFRILMKYEEEKNGLDVVNENRPR